MSGFYQRCLHLGIIDCLLLPRSIMGGGNVLLAHLKRLSLLWLQRKCFSCSLKVWSFSGGMSRSEVTPYVLVSVVVSDPFRQPSPKRFSLVHSSFLGWGKGMGCQCIVRWHCLSTFGGCFCAMGDALSNSIVHPACAGRPFPIVEGSKRVRV